MLSRRAMGFGLVELVIAVSILAILTAAAMPSLTTWVRNSRVRTVADALQSGLRVAQAEAQRQTHSVVFFLTNAKTCQDTDTAASNGVNWQVRLVRDTLSTDDTAAPTVIQCGVLTDVSSGVGITTTSTAVCFNGDGRQTTLTSPESIGVNCTAGAAQYAIAASGVSGGDNRPLQVNVTRAGAVRMCDPAKASTAPDGCR